MKDLVSYLLISCRCNSLSTRLPSVSTLFIVREWERPVLLGPFDRAVVLRHSFFVHASSGSFFPFSSWFHLVSAVPKSSSGHWTRPPGRVLRPFLPSPSGSCWWWLLRSWTTRLLGSWTTTRTIRLLLGDWLAIAIVTSNTTPEYWVLWPGA